MARTPSGRRTAGERIVASATTAQRGSDEPAGGDRDAESVGVTASLYGHTTNCSYATSTGLRGFRAARSRAKGAKRRGIRCSTFRRLGAHTREASACPSHSVYGLPERRSADMASCDPLPPAPTPKAAQRRAGQRHGADGSGILRRGAVTAIRRAYCAPTTAQGTRIVAARLSGQGFTPPRSAPTDS
ncbi:MAG: hypothetical protein ACLRMJ_10420 [Alistipes finegoldii]